MNNTNISPDGIAYFVTPDLSATPPCLSLGDTPNLLDALMSPLPQGNNRMRQSPACFFDHKSIEEIHTGSVKDRENRTYVSRTPAQPNARQQQDDIQNMQSGCDGNSSLKRKQVHSSSNTPLGAKLVRLSRVVSDRCLSEDCPAFCSKTAPFVFMEAVSKNDFRPCNSLSNYHKKDRNSSIMADISGDREQRALALKNNKLPKRKRKRRKASSCSMSSSDSKPVALKRADESERMVSQKTLTGTLNQAIIALYVGVKQEQQASHYL
jgi:hypothetical protein